MVGPSGIPRRNQILVIAEDEERLDNLGAAGKEGLRPLPEDGRSAPPKKSQRVIVVDREK